MSQHDHVTEPRSISPSPQYQGESEDLEIQDIKCNTCGKTFTRLDHLRRHERGHTAEKPFACGECKRRFARLDVLRRHQSSHELSRKGGADGSRRYARACVACATARVKCSGGTVCHRCRSRDLQCGYPIRRNRKCKAEKLIVRTDSSDSRATTRPDPQDDTVAIERDHDSGVAVSSFEDRSNSEVFELRPDEDVWSSQPVEVLEYDTSPVGQSHDQTGSGVAPTATGSSTQDVLPDTSPMSTEDRLIRKDFIEPAQTIIPGACLSPHVSEVNIGSIYNYSKINWLPSGGQSQINRRTSAHMLQSIDSVSVNSQYTFPSENQDQLLQQSVRQDNMISNHSNTSSPAVTISVAGSPSGVPMYYVDGEGAGIPIPAHQRQQSHSLFGDQNSSPLNHNNHDSLRVFNSYSNPGGEPGIWSSESYIALTEYLQRTPRRHLAVRHIDSLPSLEILNFFAKLYFDKFHSSFPLLHKGTFLSSRNGCLLELVISAIGACYVRTPYARKSSESLHELAHELLKIDKISDDSQREFPNIFGLQQSERYQSTTRLQAGILNVLGMFHSGNPKLTSFAREDRANLVTACIENQMLTSNHYSYLQGTSGVRREEDQILQGWLEGELKCRAGYFVWMLDCMMAYESDFRTHMNLSDGKAPLPCPEQIWDQPVPPMSQLLILNSGPPSLCTALNVLYTEKILVPNLGELSRILLIHGMYRRVWEVSRYHNDSLSDWVPTSLSEPRHTVTSGRSTRPWSNPVISRWINGSCDCLDVLHWSAYTTILQASGFEHPTVLQLHFSRLILLAPVSDLQELAKTKLHQESRRNSNSYLFPAVQDQVCPKSLVDWVVHDQSKARLAIIHAGSVFWHLRRYSCGTVIEPFAKYLATLVIWAYNVASLAARSTPIDIVYEPHGVQSSRIRRTSSTSHQNQDLHHTTASEDANNLNPSSPYSHVSGGLEQLGTHGTTIIQLDRPCDDELVHMFVRFGDEMTPYMAQIGDIKQRDAAGKILKEGIRLLSSHDDHKKRGGNDKELGGGGGFIWGIAGEFVALLDALGSAPV